MKINYNNVGEVYDSYEDDQIKYVCPTCYKKHEFATKYCSVDCFKKEFQKEIIKSKSVNSIKTTISNKDSV
tara:strand:+ start:279 stop:491 length:213 start_codon:yes stop_codon:yes gene_type:complete